MTKKLLKNSLLLFLSGIIIVSCTLEKDALEEHEHRKLTEQRISLYEIPGLQSKINARIQTNKSMNRGEEIDYLELINPDNVLLIEEENGNKHYTFSLNMQENNTLTNVVIKQVGTEIDYKVIEYASPDIEQWLIDNIDNGYSTITPTISEKGTNPDRCPRFHYRCPSPEHHTLEDLAAGKCSIEFSAYTIMVTYVFCGTGAGDFDHFDDVGGSSNTGSPSDNNYGSGGNNNTTFTNPNPPCDPRVDCPLFDGESDPCESLKKNTTKKPSYMTNFNSLNDPLAYDYPYETGFAMRTYPSGTPYYSYLSPSSEGTSLIIPPGCLNYTHIHNNKVKTVNGNSIDHTVKMFSPADLYALLTSCQVACTNNGASASDAFGVMLSNEGIFAISLLGPYAHAVDFNVKWQKFLDNYQENTEIILFDTSLDAEERKEALEKMFLQELKALGLEDKVGFFEGTVTTEAGVKKLNWTRKTLNSDTVTPNPC